MPLVPLDLVQQFEGRRVDVLAVVVEWGIPKVTGGSDMKMGLVIVDSSERELNVTMFLPRPNDFPAYIEPGDVIHLSHVKIRIYQNELFATFMKKFSKYAIYRGSHIGNYDPYLPLHASLRAPLNNILQHEIRRLRLWYPNFHLSAGKRQYLLSLKELRTNNSEEKIYFDLVCKVLHIAENDDHEMVLYVWDGTDAPQCINNKIFYNEDVNPLPIRNDLNSLPRSVLNRFPKAGTILKLTVYVDVQTFAAKYFDFNDRWVRMRNIYTQYLHHGMWEAATDDLKIRILPDTDLMVKECAKNYVERMAKSQCMPVSYNPSTTQLTEIVIPNNDRVGYSTLLNVVACEEVGHIFKCVVRIVALRPAEVIDDYRLTLEDPTTRIHVFLTTNDELFLDFIDGSVSYDIVSSKFNKLLGTPQDEMTRVYGFFSPPWIECILKTSLADPMDVNGSRKYHLVCTRVI
uniref:Protection of telomeres protein 1 n=1 Tax=Kalanchoe fedtschenkoi TaxID=63787 RepID=A0A7N0SX49_KALFE